MTPDEPQTRSDASVQIAYLTAELAEERETLDAVNRIGTLLSAELNLDRLVQAATDAATELTGAEFGSFFYNVVDDSGESYILYTISGVPREMFTHFPMPRNTPVFGPTFRGEGIIRLDDVTQDPRYGRMDTYHGMPPGHLPVRSYLALPVVSRSGAVLGGLFFGHSRTGVFTERAGRNVQALVAQLAAAMDNARLFGEALRATEEARSATARALQEVEERKRAEDALVMETRHAALRADVSAALAQGGPLRAVLQRCAEPLVRHLDGAFARIWTVDAEENVLVLQASAGMYTHVDGPHGRVPIGDKKIGQIAAEKMPYLTNDVLADTRISEKEWARREKMVAFAGYPLLIEDRVVGVVALFARHELPLSTLEEIAAVADMLAQGVERKRMEQRLTESELRQRTLVKDVLASVTDGRLRLCSSTADLPARLPPIGGEPISLSKYTLRALRNRATDAAHVAALPHERELDLLTATNEAAMNAVVHAGGGSATVGADAETGAVQIWVEDRGGGIDMRSLPRATLDRGYTTAGTLGHGFKMVLNTIDAVWLLTGPEGTTVVLSQGREALKPGWLDRV
jgi:GAF domain-containing protein/anti-sigma regulatory factor (Ser/Thr protein kinase)